MGMSRPRRDYKDTAVTYTTAELLAPAGNPEALDAALAEGADAVYLGLKNFNARMRTNNFAYSQFEAAAEAVHKQGKKIYVTVNTVFEQREADRMYQLLQYLEKVGPDGIIVQDLGVVKMARDHFPGLKLHASTQMNVSTALGANFLSRYGFKRVVLSRELSLEEMKAVRLNTNMELETFVHGALCVSASGLCLFSSYLGGRSANRGACTQACRRLFRSEGDEDGYYFSPDDLQLVEKVPELVEAGLTTFKIEGRMKSADYVGTVVAAYRHMLDNWRFDRERAATKALSILQGDFARHKTTFWFDGSVAPDYIRPGQAGGTGIALGKVKMVRVFEEQRWLQVSRHEGISEGDSVRIHKHGDSGRVTAKVRGVMDIPDGYFLRVDDEFGPQDEVYLVQTKSLSKRYRPVLPAGLAKYHKFPSYDSAPNPTLAEQGKDKQAGFPDGMYAMVNRVQDLHVLQADRPKKAILRLTRKNAELMRKHEKELPFKGDELVLWLEPFFPQADADWLAEEVEYWLSKGQKYFIANNLGQLALLKGRDAVVAAGPWLYSFNAWSASFLLANGVQAIIPPLEISKQDFQKVAELVPSGSYFPIVFAYPQLFTVRSDLGADYKFRFFSDREGADYELVNDQSGSVVIPVKPFSLVDRIPFLKKDGVGKFILDYSFIDLKKQVYKRVNAAARDGIVLPETGRFNWKEGFWQPEEDGPSLRSYGKSDGGDRPAAGGAKGAGAGKSFGDKSRYEAAVIRAKKAAGRPGRGGKPQWFDLEAGAAAGRASGKSAPKAVSKAGAAGTGGAARDGAKGKPSGRAVFNSGGPTRSERGPSDAPRRRGDAPKGRSDAAKGKGDAAKAARDAPKRSGGPTRSRP